MEYTKTSLFGETQLSLLREFMNTIREHFCSINPNSGFLEEYTIISILGKFDRLVYIGSCFKECKEYIYKRIVSILSNILSISVWRNIDRPERVKILNNIANFINDKKINNILYGKKKKRSTWCCL